MVDMFKGAVFAGRFNRTIGKLLQGPVFKCNLDGRTTNNKGNQKLFMTPINASFKSN